MSEKDSDTGGAKSEPTGLSEEELEGASGGNVDDWRCRSHRRGLPESAPSATTEAGNTPIGALAKASFTDAEGR